MTEGRIQISARAIKIQSNHTNFGDHYAITIKKKPSKIQNIRSTLLNLSCILLSYVQTDCVQQRTRS